VELGRDVDAAADATGDWAPRSVGVVRPFDGLPIGIGRHAELVANVDPLDDKDLVLDLDVAYGVTPETTAPGGDVARLERAPECARQSAGGGCHHVVERGGVGFVAALGGAVMRSDGAMDTEGDRPLLGRDPRVAERSLGPFDIDFGSVHDLAHVRFLLTRLQLRQSKPSVVVAPPLDPTGERGGGPIDIIALVRAQCEIAGARRGATWWLLWRDCRSGGHRVVANRPG